MKIRNALLCSFTTGFLGLFIWLCIGRNGAFGGGSPYRTGRVSAERTYCVHWLSGLSFNSWRSCCTIQVFNFLTATSTSQSPCFHFAEFSLKMIGSDVWNFLYHWSDVVLFCFSKYVFVVILLPYAVTLHSQNCVMSCLTSHPHSPKLPHFPSGTAAPTVQRCPSHGQSRWKRCVITLKWEVRWWKWEWSLRRGGEGRGGGGKIARSFENK